MCDITSFLYKTGVITVQAVGMPCPVSQQADNMAFICQFRTRSSKWFGCRRWNYRASTGKQTGSMHAGIDLGCQGVSTSSSMKNTINTVLATNEAEF